MKLLESALNKPIDDKDHSENVSVLSLDDIITIDELVEANNKLLTKPQLQWLCKQRRQNGLEASGAILKRGRKLYIRKKEFTQWFLSKKGGGQ